MCLLAIVVIVCLSAMVFPIVFLLDMAHTTRSTIASISFAIAGLATLSILFGGKFYFFIVSPIQKKYRKSGRVSMSMSERIGDDVSVTRRNLTALSASATPDEQWAHYQEQIRYWQGMMCNIDLHSNGSNGSVTESNKPANASGRVSDYVKRQENNGIDA